MKTQNTIKLLILWLLCMTQSYAQAPSNLRYSQGEFLVYTQGDTIPYNFFQYDGAEATSISITPPLPAGITFVTDTSLNEGSMWGTPTVTAHPTDHLITVRNAQGSATISINVAVYAAGNNKVLINTNTSLKHSISDGFASAVTCWLTDSSERQDIKPSLERMRTGSLRFPYGHLSDNYLWHDIDAGNPHAGLHPIIASTSQPPAGWSWATSNDDTFINAMDFDEYMSICTELGIKPLVVVNMLSHKYSNGPSLSHLIDTAAAWVQYAKDKNYEVAYWQIGNEIDHHSNLLSRTEYVTAYHQMVDAMKAINPDILTGPGILSDMNYMRAVTDANPNNVDFLSAHQYIWSLDIDTYEKWRDFTGNMIPAIDNAVTVSREYNNMPILITETNAYGSAALLEGNTVNNFLKALCWFELLMQQVHAENAVYSYYWGTSDPWNYQNGGLSNEESYTLLKNDATLSMRAEISRFVNEYTLDEMVQSQTSISRLRTYASLNSANDRINLFFLNKDSNRQPIDVTVNGMNLPENYSVRSYSADSPHSLVASYTNSAEGVSISGNSFTMELLPLSITVVSFYAERSFQTLFPYLLMEADENLDGKSNYLNYAQGFNPSHSAPTGGINFNGESFQFVVRNNATDVQYALYWTTDFSEWNPMTAGIDYTTTLESQDTEQKVYKGILAESLLQKDKCFFLQSFNR
ncbi:hypothetical protein QEH59_06960 [Coraliomargarita sp. SDUM461004]|uniref:Alpha-L-arabinofuranosidase 1 catalytic domain-containing protein n=1 Tax=Thalassobacterium sedimentorum TaxID=3041258 RepID=A0ABU1AH56_9BACT|nr:hypothetical protein [Coraliomargarita sp. SDUM461004]MDQ8194157.1 hypothetical protein [Coraliomargarita sp. SDUM461004]